MTGQTEPTEMARAAEMSDVPVARIRTDISPQTIL